MITFKGLSRNVTAFLREGPYGALRLKTKSKEMRALSFFVAENDEKKEEIR